MGHREGQQVTGAQYLGNALKSPVGWKGCKQSVEHDGEDIGAIRKARVCKGHLQAGREVGSR